MADEFVGTCVPPAVAQARQALTPVPARQVELIQINLISFACPEREIERDSERESEGEISEDVH